jgi:hypothetical protein
MGTGRLTGVLKWVVMPTIGPCALCGDTGPLEESHLTPKFVKRRVVKDSGTPYFRGVDPNRRQQDTKKIPLLCRTCEDRFSDGEAAFATAVYHPTRDDLAVDIVWTDWLMYFVASITWRNIMLALLEPPENCDLRDEDYAVMRAAEERLRPYLLGESDYPADLEHHLFIPSSGITTDHDGLNVFLHAVFGHWTPANAATDEVFSVVLIPGMVFVTLLKSDAATRALWAASNTRTVAGGNVRNWGHHLMDGFIGDLLVVMLKDHHERHARLSPEQRAKIAADKSKNPMAALDADSPLARARLKDMQNRQRFNQKLESNQRPAD